MNTPVNFEIAKLLKEKGFDFPRKASQNDYQGEMPNITEVVMWLYEKHEFWISVSIENNEEDIVSFYFSLVQNDDNEVFFKLRQSNYNSPTEAYSQAINYTLKNLI